MTRFLLIVLLFLSRLGFANSDGLKWSEGFGYEILSDDYNAAIPDGYFALVGHVYRINSKVPISNAGITSYVENQPSLSSTTSDSSGYFKLIFKISDSIVYCYREDLNEVILKGPFKNRHVIKVNFYLQEVVSVVFKPVIYTYNCASTICLSLKPKGEFTFTYPKSESGDWTVNTNPNGTLTDVTTMKNYPYIFWESEAKNLQFKTENNQVKGFLIKTDTCISFLENTLAQIGLNEKESADFITFWGPKIIQKDFALIQFLTTEQYSESIAELTISPKPNALLRLYMYFMPLDSPEIVNTIVPQTIEPFTREGFTVVEWGGSVLQQRQIIN